MLYSCSGTQGGMWCHLHGLLLQPCQGLAAVHAWRAPARPDSTAAAAASAAVMTAPDCLCWCCCWQGPSDSSVCSRQVAQARLLGEQGGSLPIHLRDQRPGHEHLLKGDMVFHIVRKLLLLPRVVL